MTGQPDRPGAGDDGSPGLGGEPDVAQQPARQVPPTIQQRFQVPEKVITAKTGKKPKTADCANNPKGAQAAVETWLAKDPSLSMVIAYIDSAGLGAYQALKQKGVAAGSVYLGSIDGQQEVLDIISRGGDGIYRFTAALPLPGPVMVDVPNNIITGSGPSSAVLNYTPLTADNPQAARDWAAKEIVPWLS